MPNTQIETPGNTITASAAAADESAIRGTENRSAGRGRYEASGPWRVVARGVTRTDGDTTILQPVDLVVRPGEIVGIAGGSGAGKTTLLETLAGLRIATTGTVVIDGVLRNGSANQTPARSRRRPPAGQVGFVPQDDIIHLDLPLRTTLELAAELRMPGHVAAEERAEAVDRVLECLDLTHRAGTTVRALSGGQRKRASIAVELLTDPGVFFLDEPTSGLDPSTSASVLGHLRTLADEGTSVVLTTHAPADLAACDRVVFMAEGGRVAYVGSPETAADDFGVAELGQVYQALSSGRMSPCRADVSPVTDLTHWSDLDGPRTDRGDGHRKVGWIRQWRALTRRATELMVRNRLTLAILVGSPIGIVAMLAVLFPAGTFGEQAGPLPGIQALFWMTFSSFFFGVTYGLLQVVGEVEIVRRERMNGLNLGAYVCSKLAVLGPILLMVNVAMFAVLRAFDRFPAADLRDWPWLIGAGTLISFAGVALGLLASSLVQNPAQATLALPMLCFPQVLFAGAAIPVSDMTVAGRFMSHGMANRWGFESIGRTLGLGVDVGPASDGFAHTFTGSRVQGVVVLILIATGITMATWALLDRRLRAR